MFYWLKRLHLAINLILHTHSRSIDVFFWMKTYTQSRCYIWFRRSFVVTKVRKFKECHFKLNEVISSKIELYIEFIMKYKYDFSLTRKIKGQIQISGSLHKKIQIKDEWCKMDSDYNFRSCRCNNWIDIVAALYVSGKREPKKGQKVTLLESIISHTYGRQKKVLSGDEMKAVFFWRRWNLQAISCFSQHLIGGHFRK